MAARPGRLRGAAALADMVVDATRLAVADPLDGVRLAVPTEVRLHDGRLEWRVDSDWRTGALADRCLWDFLRLADEADDASVSAFAKRYGVLGIRANGKPGTADGGFPPSVDEGGIAWFTEPIEAWRTYARNAKAALTLAMALRGGHRINPRRVLTEGGFDVAAFTPPIEMPYFEGDPPGATAYLQTLHLLEPATFVDNMDTSPGQGRGTPKSLTDQRRWLGFNVGLDWLRHAAISPRIVWDGEKPRLTLGLSERWSLGSLSAWPANSLFSVLSAQLAGVLCSGEYLARCDGCKQFHEGERRPRSDQPNYCGEECRQNARRQTKRESAARRRTAEKASPPA